MRPIADSDHTETLLKRVLAPAFIGALLIAGVPVRLLMELWAPLGYLFWVIGPVVFAILATKLADQGLTPARCPACRRQLRNGQTRCHKCATAI